MFGKCCEDKILCDDNMLCDLVQSESEVRMLGEKVSSSVGKEIDGSGGVGVGGRGIGRGDVGTFGGELCVPAVGETNSFLTGISSKSIFTNSSTTSTVPRSTLTLPQMIIDEPQQEHRVRGRSMRRRSSPNQEPSDQASVDRKPASKRHIEQASQPAAPASTSASADPASGNEGSRSRAGRPNVPVGGMGNDDDVQQRRRTTNDDDDKQTSSCSDAKTRAAAVESVGPTLHGPQGSHLGVVIVCAGEPELGIDSPTMPGMDEDHTHPSRGSLTRFVVDPVRSNVLRPTGMSTTADGKGMLDNFEIDDPVRSNDLRPTGMSTTENSSGALDDLNSNETLDNLDLASCPGDVRPTRIMAESLSKVIVPEMLASSDPKVWPGLTVLDPPNSTNQYKADKSWINTEYGEMRPENKAREAGVATHTQRKSP